ncbi:MAG: DUF445 family protein [Lachnospiraceae bacterium]|nr:DUF445 family protein [Lachnospiraceae bacterium]
MDIVNIVAGPLIGAVIGYFTNFIAVKMLFRPLHEVKIGNFRLPFTPGIIPKGRERLAKALGVAVGDNLLTKEDLEKIFFSDSVKQVVVDSLMQVAYSEKTRESSLQELLSAHMEPGNYLAEKERLENLLCERLQRGIDSLDIVKLVNEESKRVIREKIRGSLFERMISDELIEGITSHVGTRVERYVQENGRELIFPVVDEQVASLEQKSVEEILENIGVNQEKMRKWIEDAYMHFVQEKVSDLAGQFPIGEMVEDKVRRMDVLEIEGLVLSVMKQELNSIVNLGAVIGFVIGIVNIFI